MEVGVDKVFLCAKIVKTIITIINTTCLSLYWLCMYATEGYNINGV